MNVLQPNCKLTVQVICADVTMAISEGVEVKFNISNRFIFSRGAPVSGSSGVHGSWNRSRVRPEVQEHGGVR